MVFGVCAGDDVDEGGSDCCSSPESAETEANRDAPGGVKDETGAEEEGYSSQDTDRDAGDREPVVLPGFLHYLAAEKGAANRADHYGYEA